METAVGFRLGLWGRVNEHMKILCLPGTGPKPAAPMALCPQMNSDPGCMPYILNSSKPSGLIPSLDSMPVASALQITAYILSFLEKEFQIAQAGLKLLIPLPPAGSRVQVGSTADLHRGNSPPSQAWTNTSISHVFFFKLPEK